MTYNIIDWIETNYRNIYIDRKKLNVILSYIELTNSYKRLQSIKRHGIIGLLYYNKYKNTFFNTIELHAKLLAIISHKIGLPDEYIVASLIFNFSCTPYSYNYDIPQIEFYNKICYIINNEKIPHINKTLSDIFIEYEGNEFKKKNS